MVNLQETVMNMVNAERTIDQPAYQYVEYSTMQKEIDDCVRREKERTGASAVRIRYRTKNQIQDEKEELSIAGEIDMAKDVHDLGVLLREGKMKEFYATANRIMRVKRSNPVVSKIKRCNESGDTEVFEDRSAVELAIAEYFADVYKRPEHMVTDNNNDSDMMEEQINTTSLFTNDDVVDAAKCSNFNKGLGPDCFDGNQYRDERQDCE